MFIFSPLCFSAFFVSYWIPFCFVLYLPFLVEAVLKCLVFFRCQIVLFGSMSVAYQFVSLTAGLRLWDHLFGWGNLQMPHL